MVFISGVLYYAKGEMLLYERGISVCETDLYEKGICETGICEKGLYQKGIWEKGLYETVRHRCEIVKHMQCIYWLKPHLFTT